MSEIDVSLLRKTLEHILSDPEHWNQACWLEKRSRCGTIGCLAGWAAQLSPRAETHKNMTWLWSVDGGEALALPRAAETVLGLTEEQSDRLFDGDNSMRDLWMWASEYTRGEIELPPEGSLPDEQFDWVPFDER